VALVGVPDPEWGESVLACVVPTPDAAGAALTADALRDFVRPRLAGYKCPRYVELIDALPTTSATSKVQKSVLRERFKDTVGEKHAVGEKDAAGVRDPAGETSTAGARKPAGVRREHG
jgi:acyl-CoA synthetase (AMP-forming)/AMP-acid ligase II